MSTFCQYIFVISSTETCHFDNLRCCQRRKFSKNSGLILGLHPANEKRRCFVTTSLIGWVQAQNQPRNYSNAVSVCDTFKQRRPSSRSWKSCSDLSRMRGYQDNIIGSGWHMKRTEIHWCIRHCKFNLWPEFHHPSPRAEIITVL